MLDPDQTWITIGGGVSSLILGIVVLVVRPKLIRFVSTVIAEEYRSPRLTAGVGLVLLLVGVAHIVVGVFALAAATG